LQILVGVTGGIAAYKAAGVIRGFTELGHNVRVLPTQNALRFIGATTLEALSHNAIDPDLYTDVESVKHIALAQEADLIVVAPATAAFIARYASGLADDLLLNVLLATKAKVVVAPAMHTEMWQHPATVANVETLRNRGVAIIEPESGRLTGQESGPGRLPEPESIVKFALRAMNMNQDLSGYHFTIASGGTREPIDAVRFIGNRSSGKQGIALADEVIARGGKVTLIAANLEMDISRFSDVRTVFSTAELQQALNAVLESSDVVLMPAAVSDYRVDNVIEGKLSRTADQTLDLHLVANPDVLAGLAAMKSAVDTNAILVGFAAEVLEGTTDSLKQRGQAKLVKKNVDMIVSNDVSNGAVFDADSNSVVIVTNDKSTEFAGTKREVAREIVDEVLALLSNR
jgi:phosphopantothenoylcysteine decarboxylase/phosphopantothenate--cysteine ligase